MKSVLYTQKVLLRFLYRLGIKRSTAGFTRLYVGRPPRNPPVA